MSTAPLLRADHDRQNGWALRWGGLVIALAVLAVYWPLSSFQFTVAHGDTLNCWLPWRWFISSCLQDGHFPLWNPHQQFGYPMHADLQGPAWYVEAIALGGTVGHGIHTLQALYLLYLMIGGWGMAYLVRTLHTDARTGLFAGVAYALGGFFTGHQMHFYSIISAAWLPWLFAAALRLFREPGWRNAARVALCQGLLLTGGNHTFSIIACYLLLALFALHAFANVRNGGWASVRPLLLWCLVAAVGAACIAAGVLHALWETGPSLARSGGLAYEAAKEGPLTLRSLISLLFPFATGTDMARLGTDAPMANAYMGALLLPLAFAALFRKRTAIENILLVGGVITALAAFGEATPVHRLLWQTLPGLDLFRFPAYFRWFTWLAVVVLAAGTLHAHWSGQLRPRVMTLLLIGTGVIASGLALAATTHLAADGTGDTLFERMRAMDLDSRILLSAIITVPALAAAAWLAWRRRLTFPWLLGLLLLEMGWNTSLAQWNTAIADIRPHWLQERLAALSDGPVVPEMRPTRTYDDNGARLHHLSHNTQDFLGGFSRNGVNTFWLRNAMELELEHTALWNTMARQPVVYLADTLIPWERYHGRPFDEGMTRRPAVLAPGVAANVPVAAPTDHATLTGFRPDAFTIKCTTEQGALLVLQQTRYPAKELRTSGWAVRVDGELRELRDVNIAAMAVDVPPGQHTVEFRYEKPLLPWLLGLSLITLFGALFAVVLPGANVAAAGGAFLLLASTCWSLFAHGHGELPRTEAAMDRTIHELPDNASVVLNDDGTSPMPTQGDMVGWRMRADEPCTVAQAAATLAAAWAHRTSEAPGTEREVRWIDAALKADPTVRAMITDRYEVVRTVRVRGSVDLQLAPRTTPVAWHTVAADTERRWLSQQAPYGSGCTLSMDTLALFPTGSLVVDLSVDAPRAAEAMVVLERKRGDLTTDYRTLPLCADARPGIPGPAYAVLPIEEVLRGGEELKIYVWSHQGDSISQSDFRVRLAPKTFYSW